MVNAVFEYGQPEKIRIHSDERIKYPAEFEACLHAYDPQATRFVPAPKSKRKIIVPESMRPDSAWCTGCRAWHPASAFHKDSTRPNGLQHYCIDARAARRKAPTAKKDVAWNWHRGTR
jgi:hypothetical protein